MNIHTRSTKCQYSRSPRRRRCRPAPAEVRGDETKIDDATYYVSHVEPVSEKKWRRNNGEPHGFCESLTPSAIRPLHSSSAAQRTPAKKYRQQKVASGLLAVARLGRTHRHHHSQAEESKHQGHQRGGLPRRHEMEGRGPHLGGHAHVAIAHSKAEKVSESERINSHIPSFLCEMA